jgi:hypothetical protein
MNEKSKSTWCNPKHFLFGLACLVILIGLFYAEEDWRGWHAWNKFKHKWEAKGEKFDRASVIPPAVPDDQNFALTPIVASSYESLFDQNGREMNPRNTNVVDRLKMTVAQTDDVLTRNLGNWQKSTVTDLKVWQQYYRAQAVKTNEFPVAMEPQSPAADVLLALSKYDPAIEEVRQAGRLPFSRFPLNYHKDNPAAILLPHLASLRGCARVLQLRGMAELQNGQSDKALEDVKLTLRLVDSLRTEPILISHLVRIAILQAAIQPVWEGLAEQKWSDAQLAELDRELSRLDFLADYHLSMRGELVLFQDGIFEFLRRHREELFNLSDGNSPPPSLMARFAFHLPPGGWFYQNQLHCARPMVELYLPLADVNQRIISPAATRRADTAVNADTKHTTPYNIIEKMLLPALGNAARRFAIGQSSVDLARVGIALERYRLTHGGYPETLDALAPQFMEKIPHDVINGQPLHYRREANGQFVLYSVGWNETDDDGEVVLKSGSTPGVDLENGDWAWRYPAK